MFRTHTGVGIDSWFHLVVVVKGFVNNRDGISVYTNGSRTAGDRQDGPTGYGGGSVKRVCFGNNVNTQLEVDDFAIWFKELSATEIFDLFSA